MCTVGHTESTFPWCAMRIWSYGSTCNQSCKFLCGALGWRNEELAREQMEEKGGGRRMREGITARKKQEAQLGPTGRGLNLRLFCRLWSILSQPSYHSMMGHTRTTRNNELQFYWKLALRQAYGVKLLSFSKCWHWPANYLARITQVIGDLRTTPV